MIVSVRSLHSMWESMRMLLLPSSVHACMHCTCVTVSVCCSRVWLALHVVSAWLLDSVISKWVKKKNEWKNASAAQANDQFKHGKPISTTEHYLLSGVFRSGAFSFGAFSVNLSDVHVCFVISFCLGGGSLFFVVNFSALFLFISLLFLFKFGQI